MYLIQIKKNILRIQKKEDEFTLVITIESIVCFHKSVRRFPAFKYYLFLELSNP